jgi:HAD superfamily hydrolase (TIGR01549 family)
VTIRGVLFDVGGPLDLEIVHEQQCDEAMLRALHAVGVEADEEALRRANEWAVNSFAPFTYRAILWRLAGNPRAAAEALRIFEASSAERREKRGGIELRPGIDGVLRDLAQRGLRLGLAANQPAAVIADLDRWGLGQLFSHREVSGHHGYLKPDVRLFLRACADLDVEPAETIMVGDRIDNDIFPAGLLGMKTVLFRTGRHINQQPRANHEVPDAEVTDTAGLALALQRLIAR